jgi:hypothetical protein
MLFFMSLEIFGGLADGPSAGELCRAVNAVIQRACEVKVIGNQCFNRCAIF